MPDFPKFLDLSSLFVALTGVLFGLWYPVIDAACSALRPPMYLNRADYIRELSRAIIGKSVPLFLFTTMYVVSLCGVMIRTYEASFFTLRPSAIAPVPTLFSLTYVLSVYLSFIAGCQLWRALLLWWQSDAGKEPTQPRITLLR